MNIQSIIAAHAQMVAKLVKPGEAILKSLTPEKADLWHMATGVSGESGELLDAVKKVVAYNRPLDRANVIEELGDLEFFMEGVRNNLRITREETLAANMEKLEERYEGFNYSDEQAHLRRDKQ
jgi:NTP pyrophosphatase (non-canonical NTP hydrolase)